jgi:hypothetical protein
MIEKPLGKTGDSSEVIKLIAKSSYTVPEIKFEREVVC